MHKNIPNNSKAQNAGGPLALNLVLVQPQIPQNTGNVARTCACTGASLHLVGPMGFTITDAKLKRAGLDYWDKLNVQYYSTLEGFLQTAAGPLFLFTTKGSKNYTQICYPQGSYLLFGREDAGLPQSLLQAHKNSCVRLPMQGSLRSLNLANTVAVACYEVLRQWGFAGLG